MKRITMTQTKFSILALIVLFAIGCGPAPSTQEVALTLDDLDVENVDKGLLEILDPLQDDGVTYIQMGVEEYDELFRDIARMTGTLMMVKNLAVRIESGNTEDLVAYGYLPDSDEMFAEGTQLHYFAREYVPTVFQNAKEMMNDTDVLQQRIQSDVSNLNLRMIPVLIQGIATSMSQLSDIAEELENLDIAINLQDEFDTAME